MVPARVRRPTPDQLIWIVALICGVAPLWATRVLPFVDLPQHLHLISALHRLDDLSTLYPDFFARRTELTPYLGYYYVVSTLNWLMPLEVANKVFLSVVVAGLPLSLAFLLWALGRPTWPALLALPFAYGDSLSWGFINYCASLPLAVITCAFFVKSISSPAPERRPWTIGLAVSLVLVLLFHVQAFAWLGIGLPLLLISTPAPEGRNWRARIPALVGVVPGVVLFVLWIGLRVGQPQEIAPGQPWRSWGPMLSAQNLGWKTFDQNLGELVTIPQLPPNGARDWLDPQFPHLAGTLHDRSDQRAVKVVLLLAFIAVAVRLARGPKRLEEQVEGPVARWRLLALAVLAFILYFALPFDIRGYMYYLNTRYVHLAAALLVAAVPVLPVIWNRRFLTASAIAVLLTALPLWSAYRQFDVESGALTELSRAAAPKARVMGLMYATGSAVVTHPVYLHASCAVAREAGGITNFSFALTPHNPLLYKTTPPPTFPSEWQPQAMRWEEHGRHYDHFVVRGPSPEQLFGRLLNDELYVAAKVGDFSLVRKR